MNQQEEKSFLRVSFVSLHSLLKVCFGTFGTLGAFGRYLAYIQKPELGSSPRDLKLETIHCKAITAMDFIQRITALLKTDPNTLQLWILETEDGIHMKEQSTYSISNLNHEAILQNPAKPDYSSGLSMPKLKHKHLKPVWTKRQKNKIILHLRLSRIVLLYSYCLSIITNNTCFTFKDIIGQAEKYSINSTNNSFCCCYLLFLVWVSYPPFLGLTPGSELIVHS